MHGREARNLHESAGSPLVGRGGISHAAQEKIAEATQAGHADFKAGLCNGEVAGGEEMLGPMDSTLNPELVRRATEEGLKLPDEMERGNLHGVSDGLNRSRIFGWLGQHLAREAEAGEDIVPRSINRFQYPTAGRSSAAMGE